MAQFGGQKNSHWPQFSTAVPQTTLTVQPTQQSLLGNAPTLYGQPPTLASIGNQAAAAYPLTQLQQQQAALQQQQQQQQQAALQHQQQQQAALHQFQPTQTSIYGVQQASVAIPSSLSSPQQASQMTISYPAPRVTQLQAQLQAHQQQQQQVQLQAQPPPQKQRVFTGVVTKLHDNFGFVDEDVFFQLSAVKGKTPTVGDRVLVEATYNANMPFKWNAQRVQTLPTPNQGQMKPSQSTGGGILHQQHQPQPSQYGLSGQTLQPQQQAMVSTLQSQAGFAQPALQGQTLQAQPFQPPTFQPSTSLQTAALQATSLQASQPLQTQSLPTQPLQAPALQSQALQNQALQSGALLATTLFAQQPQAAQQLLQQVQEILSNQEGKKTHGARVGIIPGPNRPLPLLATACPAIRRPEPPLRLASRPERTETAFSRRAEQRREHDRHWSRDRSPLPRKRSRSPLLERSPRRSRRALPRYIVEFSHFSLDCTGCDVLKLRRRYQNLYVPSDFFDTNFSWVDVFPLSRPFRLGNACSFHVMHKDVEPLQAVDATLEPSDANHLYSAKVMLMASPSLEEVYHRSCALAQDPEDMQESCQHPARLIKFLVGQKGKDETMAIGGPWSPSLDGPDPDTDPSVLIRTAVRCTKALTGVDLSKCTQWYRFAEIRYYRPEEQHKGRRLAARVDTVVIFLPDVWLCTPTRLEWETLSHGYKQQLLRQTQGEQKEADGEQDEEEEKDVEPKLLSSPTHYSKLEPKNMKVIQLRQELDIRGINAKGLKPQLVARLGKQLRQEEELEQQEVSDKKEKTKDAMEDVKEEVKRSTEDDEKEKQKKEEDEEKKRQEESERQRKERRFTLPEMPSIIVHPSVTAKSGKFDCSVMSLSVMLDYRIEDNKEHSFEVSLFAELFNEMLQRDFGFCIYKAIVNAPDRKKDKEDKKKDRKDEKKDKKEKHEGKLKKRKNSDDKEEVRPKKIKEEKKEERKVEVKDVKAEKDVKDVKDNAKEQEAKEDDTELIEGKDEEAVEVTGGKQEVVKNELSVKEKQERVEKEERKTKKKQKEEEEEEVENDESSGDDDTKKDVKQSRSKSKSKEKEKENMKTIRPDLLLAFTYFDQSHWDYLQEKDLEELVYTLGLHLSRAQIKKLLSKVLSQDLCHYRRLTDAKQSEDAQLEATVTDEVLAKGNHPLLPQGAACTQVTNVTGKEDGKPDMVTYNGALVDVGSLLERLCSSEHGRSQLEIQLHQLQQEMDKVSSNASKKAEDNRSLLRELEEMRGRHAQTELSLQAAGEQRDNFSAVLYRTASSLTSLTHTIQSSFPQLKEEDDCKSQDEIEEKKLNNCGKV
uniref:cell division cycle and apoptosis regulator protein 1 isoform X2 n=1 Tax=Myxine glutinosa TaxID=7769 RepID=UPI00358FABF8